MVADAADEDGGRRGDCTTPPAVRMPRSRSSPSARPTARASSSRSACRTCSRSSSTHTFDGCVEGINDLNAQYTTSVPAVRRPGRRQLRPDHLDHLLGVPLDDRPRRCSHVLDRGRRPLAHPQGAEARRTGVGLAAWRSGRGRHLARAILVGWIFTEMGRQPWIVFSLMLPRTASRRASPGWTVLISLVAFTAIYGDARRRRVRAHHEDRTEGPRSAAANPATPRPGASKTPRRRSTRRSESWISPTSGSGSSAFLFVGYFVLDGFDFGVGMSLPFLGKDDIDRRRSDQHDRPGLGPQRDLGHRRRRLPVRGVPRVVRHAVQRVLPRPAADPARPDRCAGSRSSTATSATSRAGRSGFDTHDRRRLGGARAALGRRVREHRAGRAAGCRPRTTPASLLTC